MVQRRPRAHAGEAIKAHRIGQGSGLNQTGGNKATNRGATPSTEFDWDTALVRNARTMRDLGYKLTKEQQARLETTND